MFFEQTIRMLKKFGKRPGVRRTFRFSSRTPHAFNFFFLRAMYIIFCNLNFNHEKKTNNNEIAYSVFFAQFFSKCYYYVLSIYKFYLV